ncbi:J domain-containing protein [Pseudomonas sp. MM211]|uniref:J domain-containing protein n=1 Tax=Pseudomonas sp. MM211 TaxID=2866808 RepID=UPI001CED5C19|nr:J domain-containing protein [Pseudomonas sp. MM211]UCJ17160.1 J domain-containing protein [Pseudomonas sp. MM211]
MSPWELLGLDAEADTRTIKRRYAQLLKQTRPDEDPEAFQRLREAYEWALDWAQRFQNVEAPAAVDEPFTPMPINDAQQLTAPLTEIQQRQIDEQAWVVNLLDSCASLDEALLQAREAGQEKAFELELLRRSQLSGDQAVETVHWAMAHLHWLTPWQADYLPMPAMNFLAERLLNAELWKWHSQLADGQEHLVLESIRQLAKQPWVQPFDRSSYLQEGLLDLLEGKVGWSLSFFDEICRLFDWDEARGQLPCDDERWDELCLRRDAMALRAELRKSLNEEQPASPSSRTVWFLLKPMPKGERRKLVDGFDDADWQACEALAWRVEHHDDLLNDLGLACLPQWRDWHPGNGWVQLYPLFWLGLCLMMFVLSGASERSKGLAVSVAAVAALGTALLFVFRLLIKLWNRLARWCVVFDVGISLRLIPPRWLRGGSGLLLLRHIVPSAGFAALTAYWAGDPTASTALALTTFILCVQFVDVASRGGAPAAWLIRGWRLLASLDKLILGWGICAAIMLPLFMMSSLTLSSSPEEQQPQPKPPVESYTECQRPTDMNRAECARAMKRALEAQRLVD